MNASPPSHSLVTILSLLAAIGIAGGCAMDMPPNTAPDDTTNGSADGSDGGAPTDNGNVGDDTGDDVNMMDPDDGGTDDGGDTAGGGDMSGDDGAASGDGSDLDPVGDDMGSADGNTSGGQDDGNDDAGGSDGGGTGGGSTGGGGGSGGGGDGGGDDGGGDDGGGDDGGGDGGSGGGDPPAGVQACMLDLVVEIDDPGTGTGEVSAQLDVDAPSGTVVSIEPTLPIFGPTFLELTPTSEGNINFGDCPDQAVLGEVIFSTPDGDFSPGVVTLPHDTAYSCGTPFRITFIPPCQIVVDMP